jgi:ADP-ribose diphosphatase
MARMRAKPKILGRRLVAETRVFRVEEVELEFANGNRRRFERIPGGQASVLIVPLLDAHTVLLIREYAAGSDRYELGLAKGIMEAGEDPLTAAQREMREEVGYGARDLRQVHTVSLAPGYIQHTTHIVLARDLFPHRSEGDEPEPVEVVRWPLQDMDGLLERPDFTEARSITALYLVRRFLERESGKSSMDEAGVY